MRRKTINIKAGYKLLGLTNQVTLAAAKARHALATRVETPPSIYSGYVDALNHTIMEDTDAKLERHPE